MQVTNHFFAGRVLLDESYSHFSPKSSVYQYAYDAKQSIIHLLDPPGQNYGETLQADTHVQFQNRIIELIEMITGRSKKDIPAELRCIVYEDVGVREYFFTGPEHRGLNNVDKELIYRPFLEQLKK
ncbi:hypothetical protein ASL14_26265 (plasmid) [Paenibacillus sp. IHB B 3084]|uniref:hypothetical protein n=1 Tax=Paenibacillus sp. IHB B 3084 TaxID=867076 RepID=UPI00071F65AE|nr:hypothetical protein [Paenibacillus sp. IHB B 3084]ALP39384.1 hypothetical protein ASL14_26265 [Paenibacillus sp. IHB B 3084]